MLARWWDACHRESAGIEVLQVSAERRFFGIGVAKGGYSGVMAWVHKNRDGIPFAVFAVDDAVGRG